MALLTVAASSRAGIDLAGSAATATTGDTFPNTGAELLLVKNGGAGSINVTIDYVPTADGNAVTDPVVAIAAGVTKAIGPFPPGLYNDASGYVKATCDVVTTVTVKAIKLGNA